MNWRRAPVADNTETVIVSDYTNLGPDAGQPMKAEHTFKKIIWRNTIALSDSMEQATTWSISGVAAIAALMISNLDSVGKLVSTDGLRWSLILFTASIVAGAFGKQAGMALAKGVDLVNKTEGLLLTEEGQKLIGAMTTPPAQLMDELAEPYYWPLSIFMRNAGRKSLGDYLAADKNLVRLFCAQLVFIYLHGLLAAAGLMVIACSIY